MIRAAVLGSPISHSLSPLLHRCAYQLLGVQADYSAIEMTPERAPIFFQRAIDEDWTGFSLTMPLKETIFDYEFEPAFVIDPVAVQMRSANTLIKKEKTFWATSTDRSRKYREETSSNHWRWRNRKGSTLCLGWEGGLCRFSITDSKSI